MSLETANRVELSFSGLLATRGEIEGLCTAARRSNYRGIVIPSGSLLLAQHFLAETEMKICCEVGGTYGNADSDAKRYETELAIDAGAHEVQFTPSLARIRDGDFRAVLREIRDIAEAADERPVKVALEPALWDTTTLREFVQIVLDSGAQYVCTGETPESTLAEVEMLRSLCGPDFGIVARVAEAEEAFELLEAGANLISVKSAG